MLTTEISKFSKSQITRNADACAGVSLRFTRAKADFSPHSGSIRDLLKFLEKSMYT